MELLNDDCLVEILKYNTIKELIKISLLETYLIEFFKRNIKRFKIICSFSKITDTGLQYLTGVHTINLSDCHQITDTGLQYLTGVNTINISYCNKITDTGLQYLKGVHIIFLNGCNKITDTGLKYLKGAQIYR